MSPASSATGAKRNPVRRAGESAYGLLLLAKAGLMGVVATVLLMAGVWTSLDTMRQAVADRGGVRGTVTVEECDGWTCTGRFAPEDGAASGTAGTPGRVAVDTPVSHEAGERLPVALWPSVGGEPEVVRTGTAGVLYAWLPFAGSLVLASLVIAGGLRMRRTAWVTGALGLALTGAAFAVL